MNRRLLACVAVVGLTACRSILGLGDDPPLRADTTASPSASANASSGLGGASSSSSAASTSGGGGSGGAGGAGELDPRWARWPLPPDDPKIGNYDLGGSTVFDKTTGLGWQRQRFDPKLGQVDWTHAAQRCASLGTDGFNDWRVPTRMEMLTLVDVYDFTTINSDAFPFEGDTIYLSSTRVAASSGIFAPRFAGNFGEVLSIAQSTAASLLCVRVQRPPQNVPKDADHYAVASGVVLDRGTGLSWIQSAVPAATLSDAMNICANVPMGGFKTPWRIPSLKELWSLYDDAATSAPFWDKAVFGTVSASATPAETTFRSGVAEAALNFGRSQTVNDPKELDPKTHGNVEDITKTPDMYRVRCVHD